MSDQATGSLLAVQEIAQEAGYENVRFDAQYMRLVISLQLGEGRHQLVFVRPHGVTPRGDELVMIFAACLRLRPEALSAGEKDLPRQLLLRNWDVPYGKFALTELDGELLLVLCCDQLVPTMDAAELDAMVQYVARTADDFEASRGVDRY